MHLLTRGFEDWLVSQRSASHTWTHSRSADRKQTGRSKEAQGVQHGFNVAGVSLVPPGLQDYQVRQ